MPLTFRTMRFYTEWTTELGVALIKPVENWFNRNWPLVMRWRYRHALTELAIRHVKIQDMREGVKFLEGELDNYLRNEASRTKLPAIEADGYFTDLPMIMAREVVGYVEMNRQSVAFRLYGDEYPDGMTPHTIDRLAEHISRRWQKQAKEKLVEALARIQTKGKL